MTNRPLGVGDVFDHLPSRNDDHWYWCRRHERAEHIGWPSKDGHTAAWGGILDGDCVRIGPFMSECEANRLGAIGYIGSRPALGMEVE